MDIEEKKVPVKRQRVENNDQPENDIQMRKTPVASANGSEMAKLNDLNTNHRRKRIRITTTANTNNETYPYRRFSERNQPMYNNTQGEQDYPQHSFSRLHGQTHHFDDTRPRINYEEEYHKKRIQGNSNNRQHNSYNRFGNQQKKEFLGRDNRKYNERGGGSRKPYDRNKKKDFNNHQRRQQKQYPMPTPIKFMEMLPDDVEIRLNKLLANSGLCSRREADNFIQSGQVTVNGQVVTELGTRVRPVDEVYCGGKRVMTESKVYILLNKPKNCVTTMDDPEGRITVMDIIKNACPERVYPVGRLDRNTMGVLLITNDGELASKLTHPSFMKKKIYHVWLNKPVVPEDMQKIVDGIQLEDGEIHADALSYVKEDDQKQVGIEIHSGRNRIVRRIFEYLGYRVVKLDRVYFAGLTKKNIPRGKWRFLDAEEVRNLRMGAFE